MKCFFWHIKLWYYSTFTLESSLLKSTFVFTHHFGAKTILRHSHFEDDSSPHISGSGSLIRTDLMFVLFKHVILMWINYLETWLHWDNTSCYYRHRNEVSIKKVDIENQLNQNRRVFMSQLSQLSLLVGDIHIRESLLKGMAQYGWPPH